MAKQKQMKSSLQQSCCGNKSSVWMALLMLFVGILWLGDEIKMWGFNLPYLPLLAVLFIIYLMIKEKG